MRDKSKVRTDSFSQKQGDCLGTDTLLGLCLNQVLYKWSKWPCRLVIHSQSVLKYLLSCLTPMVSLKP